MHAKDCVFLNLKHIRDTEIVSSPGKQEVYPNQFCTGPFSFLGYIKMYSSRNLKINLSFWGYSKLKTWCTPKKENKPFTQVFVSRITSFSTIKNSWSSSLSALTTKWQSPFKALTNCSKLSVSCGNDQNVHYIELSILNKNPKPSMSKGIKASRGR